MAFIEWTAHFSVGIPSIDEQHKKLIGIMNSFHDGLMLAKEQNSPTESLQRTMQRTLNDLIEYISYHFSYEEDLMESTKYIDLIEHKEKHVRITQNVIEIQQKINWSNPSILSLELMSFLKEWLIRHIMQEDKNYTEHLISKGVS